MRNKTDMLTKQKKGDLSDYLGMKWSWNGFKRETIKNLICLNNRT